MRRKKRVASPEGQATLTRSSTKEEGYPYPKLNQLKKQDIVQVWDDRNFVCLGWGEVIGIGVGSKKGIPLIDIGSKLIWGSDYFCIPEKKALQITRRIEKDLEKVLFRSRN
ncbi:hypothetical protein ES702_07799 [subsurface metagenome]